MPKCRRPVNTIARPCSSAAAITSARAPSRPAGRRRSRRRRRPRRGRRGTERTRPTRRPIRPADRRLGRSRAFITATLHRIHAAHLTGADRQRPLRVGEDHRVRLHVRADAPGEPQRLPLLRGRLPLGRRRADPPAAPSLHGRRASPTRRAPARASRRESMRSSTPPAPSADAKSATTTRMFALRASIGARRVVHRRRDHRFDEGRDDRLGRRRRRSARFSADDAAERRQAVGLAGAHVGLGRRLRRSPRRTGWCA